MKQLSLFPENRKAKMTLGELPENQYLNPDDEPILAKLKNWVRKRGVEKNRNTFSHKYIGFFDNEIITATDSTCLIMVQSKHNSQGYFDVSGDPLNFEFTNGILPYDYKYVIQTFENTTSKSYPIYPSELVSYYMVNKEETMVIKGMEEQAFVFMTRNTPLVNILGNLKSLKLEDANLRFRNDNRAIMIFGYSNEFKADVQIYYSGEYYYKEDGKYVIQIYKDKKNKELVTPKYFNVDKGFDINDENVGASINKQTQKAQAQAQRLRLLML